MAVPGVTIIREQFRVHLELTEQLWFLWLHCEMKRKAYIFVFEALKCFGTDVRSKNDQIFIAKASAP